MLTRVAVNGNNVDDTLIRLSTQGTAMLTADTSDYSSLWQPSPEQCQQTQMHQFACAISEQYGFELADYAALHKWSVENPEQFWSALWDFCDVVSDTKGDTACRELSVFESAAWFPEARLNFSDNLLRYKDDRIALVGLTEAGQRRTLSYRELHARVDALSAALVGLGVHVGDRVAGFMPNIIETVVAMLAASRLGAVWTSCSPDFGFNGACDRFGQVEPKVLFSADGYYYNGKVIDCVAKAQQLSNEISSIEHLIVVPLTRDTLELEAGDATCCHSYQDLMTQYEGEAADSVSLPFDHPLYIMYSSGTTGKPKCIVHGAGGTLLQHRKEHVLHTDLRREDVFFYFTTCGWMMWNWLVSGLASGCAVVLYDGSPFAKDGDVLLDALEEENISVFGVGAKYIDALEKAGKKPCDTHRLDSLRTILSTGSPLSRHSFQWVYEAFKSDLCLSSISGGTDIISCFVLGNPILPVHAGEIQCIGLGMNVAFWDDDGQPLIAQKGELVCSTPFPCAPIGFWNDSNGERYHSAYFDRYPNVWAHGDYGEVTERGSVIIHGRSDAVLNPGGVRIGTAEIYRQVETLPEIIDSVVVGQQWGDDERVILFVVLRDGYVLDADLENRVRSAIRSNATPRHVPAVILQVRDIPRTMSGKVSELAVKKVIHGLPVENTDALANPEALNNFKNVRTLAPV